MVRCFRQPATLAEDIECLPNFVEPSIGSYSPGSNPYQRSGLVSLQTLMKARGPLRAGVFVQKSHKYLNISRVRGVVHRSWQLDVARGVCVARKRCYSNVLVVSPVCRRIRTGHGGYHAPCGGSVIIFISELWHCVGRTG